MHWQRNAKVDVGDLAVDRLATPAGFCSVKDSFHASIMWRLENYMSSVVSSQVALDWSSAR
uniref:Uncharacterized protein n=1 Tax=Physcomitrium patens TaxID=3218 RepID=A0A2K1KH73_PHYPA|nr:hypothetical protein PHYPA_009484 [Physcomitrium patens]